MVLLSIIHMCNGVIEEIGLKDQLKRLGLLEKEKHPIFGEWEKQIEQFVREMYLDRKKKSGGPDGKKIVEYRMGPRATMEIDKKSILQFISHTYGEQTIDPYLLKELEMENEESEDESSSSSSEEEAPSQSQSQSQIKMAKISNGTPRGGKSGRGRGKA